MSEGTIGATIGIITEITNTFLRNGPA